MGPSAGDRLLATGSVCLDGRAPGRAMLRVGCSRGVSQTGRISRSLVCRVGQPNISSLEAAVGTPSGWASHWGLVFFSLLFLIKALKSGHLDAHGTYEPFCLPTACAGWSSYCRGQILLSFPPVQADQLFCSQARWLLRTMKGGEDVSFTHLCYMCAAICVQLGEERGSQRRPVVV